MLQPVSAELDGLVTGEETERQRPKGSIWQPVLVQTPARKLQTRLRRSGITTASEALTGWALPYRGPAETQEAVRRTANRKRTVLRRREAQRMAAPWRALRTRPP